MYICKMNLSSLRFNYYFIILARLSLSHLHQINMSILDYHLLLIDNNICANIITDVDSFY